MTQNKNNSKKKAQKVKCLISLNSQSFVNEDTILLQLQQSM